jgi:hypothetical protein
MSTSNECRNCTFSVIRHGQINIIRVVTSIMNLDHIWMSARVQRFRSHVRRVRDGRKQTECQRAKELSARHCQNLRKSASVPLGHQQCERGRITRTLVIPGRAEKTRARNLYPPPRQKNSQRRFCQLCGYGFRARRFAPPRNDSSTPAALYADRRCARWRWRDIPAIARR